MSSATTGTYSGEVPDLVTLTLQFHADKTFSWVEPIAPITSPAGSEPTTCVTSDKYAGTYALSTANGADVLTGTFGGSGTTFAKSQ